MAMKLSLSIAAAFVVATLVGLSAIQPVSHPATVDRMSQEQALAAPIVLAQYSRCWNGRCY